MVGGKEEGEEEEERGAFVQKTRYSWTERRKKEKRVADLDDGGVADEALLGDGEDAAVGCPAGLGAVVLEVPEGDG